MWVRELGATMYGEAELGSRHGFEVEGLAVEGKGCARTTIAPPCLLLNGRDETATLPRSSVGCKHLQQINPTTTFDCLNCPARAYRGPSRN